MYIITDQAAFDYVTLTSFDDTFWNYWYGMLRSACSASGGTSRQHKVMQYVGDRYTVKGMNVFLGSGIQNGNYHHMLRISGALADEFSEYWLPQVKNHIAKATRLDLQITTAKPRGWSQYGLYSRMREDGKNVSGLVGTTANGETVYVGSRSSARYTRIYEKGDDNILLRFETEYKGKRAAVMAQRLANGKETPAEYLRHEVQRTGDNELNALYGHLLAKEGKTAKVVKETSRRKKWLLETVLPSFTEYINSHEADVQVLEAFQDAISCKLSDDLI